MYFKTKFSKNTFFLQTYHVENVYVTCLMQRQNSFKYLLLKWMNKTESNTKNVEVCRGRD